MSSTADYSSIFLNDVPMMDLRAPVEFSKGAFPTAVSRPLMTDDERAAVGTRYKEAGQDAAIELGHQLVCGEVKHKRVESWIRFAEENPGALLYCFRGGLRSQLTQQWLAEVGVDMPRVTGGYKAMRNFLLNELHQRIKQGNIIVLSGPTGSGKTDVIEAYEHSVDLEGLAHHRGSAFGGTDKPQPAQIGFENAWSIDWMKRTQQENKPVLFEDESRLIGRVAILPEFLTLSKRSPIVVLNAPFEERITRIRRDYFQNFFIQQQSKDIEVRAAALSDYILNALTRIQKRLGGERFKTLNNLLAVGTKKLIHQNNWSGFDPIIDILLQDYYDPMYTYQFSKKAEQLCFQGNKSEILQWLRQN